MDGSIGYGCDCGYGKQFMDGFIMNDAYAMSTISFHVKSYCEDCGSMQTKTRDEFRYNSKKALTYPHCKDLKKVLVYKEFFVDTSLKRL